MLHDWIFILDFTCNIKKIQIYKLVKLDEAKAGIVVFIINEGIKSTVIYLLYHFTF